MLAHRRQREWQHVQAIKQILSEAAGPDFIFEVAIGCGDDADVDFDVLRPPDPLERLLFEDAEQLACSAGTISPISSRNTVPPSADSNKPRFCCRASVKAPRS
jgi:hypothetical protein